MRDKKKLNDLLIIIASKSIFYPVQCALEAASKDQLNFSPFPLSSILQD